MDATELIKKQSAAEEEKEEQQLTHELLASLRKERGWRTTNLYLYQNFWCQPKEIEAIMSFQKHFKAQDADIIVATIPKSGTTWLKALAFAISTRKRFNVKENHPLLTSNPHDLVPFFEYNLYADNNIPDLSHLPSPRLFGTHVPFGSLPDSIRESNCRIVYVCRNPFDTFVSIWHYLVKIRPENSGSFSLEEAFDMYCKGVVGYGPYWDHMLGYYKQSWETPHKVLFLRYEDMKKNITFELKKLAQFLGSPFSMEEERGGVVEEIANLCSFQNLKDLEVNKEGKAISDFENKHLFRKGVGILALEQFEAPI
ncbi:hypothetical protein RJ639_012006 [Escallonia herrerae]|uniref:Sulfotransferase n=1 Tax=Escallonia herrerae TaxID=1293975 RepID=A0AA88VSC5_9ASTE|nr:hypothetical protein RJ639_012006 [Escallonia herrerae]